MKETMGAGKIVLGVRVLKDEETQMLMLIARDKILSHLGPASKPRHTVVHFAQSTRPTVLSYKAE